MFEFALPNYSFSCNTPYLFPYLDGRHGSAHSTNACTGAGDGGGNSSPPTSRATAAPPPEGVRKGPSAGDACAGTTDGGGCNRTVESGTDASAEGVQGSGQIMATPSAHQHPRHNNHDSHSQPKEKSTIFAGSFSSSVSSCAGGAVGGGSASAAHETPKRAASAPKQLVRWTGRFWSPNPASEKIRGVHHVYTHAFQPRHTSSELKSPQSTERRNPQTTTRDDKSDDTKKEGENFLSDQSCRSSRYACTTGCSTSSVFSTETGPPGTRSAPSCCSTGEGANRFPRHFHQR